MPPVVKATSTGAKTVRGAAMRNSSVALARVTRSRKRLTDGFARASGASVASVPDLHGRGMASGAAVARAKRILAAWKPGSSVSSFPWMRPPARTVPQAGGRARPTPVSTAGSANFRLALSGAAALAALGSRASSPTSRQATCRWTTAPVLIWFRHDLRLADHAALHAALATGGRVLPVFVLDDEAAGDHRHGGASRWWLKGSLASLAPTSPRAAPRCCWPAGGPRPSSPRSPQPRRRGGACRPRHGALGARAVPPRARGADGLRPRAAPAHHRVLREPHGFASGSGKPYAVYTPFAKAMLAAGDPAPPLAAPRGHPGRRDAGRRRGPRHALASIPCAGEPDWAAGFRRGLDARRGRRGGAPGALRRRPRCGPMATRATIPGIEGSSGLSPHLRFGEISPRQVWHAALAPPRTAEAAWPFLTEILWREFAYHLLWHRPEMPEAPLRDRLRRLPLGARRGAAARLAAGPHRLSDRRCRHAPALAHRLDAQPGAHDRRPRFLVKHLLQPWQDGRGLVLGHAGRCRPRLQQRLLAVGRRLRAPMPRPISASSTRCCRARSSTPTAPMSAAGCRSWRRLPDRYLHRPWEAPDARAGGCRA